MDIVSREALATEIAPKLGGEHLVTVLNRLAPQRRPPKYLFVDNGSEFSGRLLNLGEYHCKARIDFSRRGNPTDNYLHRNLKRVLARRMPERLSVRRSTMPKRSLRLGGAITMRLGLQRLPMSGTRGIRPQFKRSERRENNAQNGSRIPSGSHTVDEHGNTMLRKIVRRDNLLELFAQLWACAGKRAHADARRASSQEPAR